MTPRHAQVRRETAMYVENVARAQASEDGEARRRKRKATDEPATVRCWVPFLAVTGASFVNEAHADTHLVLPNVFVGVFDRRRAMRRRSR